MTYNDVIKRLESIGIEIDYNEIQVSDLNKQCDDTEEFEQTLRKNKKEK